MGEDPENNGEGGPAVCCGGSFGKGESLVDPDSVRCDDMGDSGLFSPIFEYRHPLSSLDPSIASLSEGDSFLSSLVMRNSCVSGLDGLFDVEDVVEGGARPSPVQTEKAGGLLGIFKESTSSVLSKEDPSGSFCRELPQVRRPGMFFFFFNF